MKSVKPRATKLNHHILFSFLHFLISSYAPTVKKKKKKSSELGGAGRGWGLQRQREGLAMTLTMEMCERWRGM